MITFLVMMVAVLYVLGGVTFTAYVEKELGKLVSSFGLNAFVDAHSKNCNTCH